MDSITFILGLVLVFWVLALLYGIRKQAKLTNGYLKKITDHIPR